MNKKDNTNKIILLYCLFFDCFKIILIFGHHQEKSFPLKVLK